MYLKIFHPCSNPRVLWVCGMYLLVAGLIFTGLCIVKLTEDKKAALLWYIFGSSVVALSPHCWRPTKEVTTFKIVGVSQFRIGLCYLVQSVGCEEVDYHCEDMISMGSGQCCYIWWFSDVAQQYVLHLFGLIRFMFNTIFRELLILWHGRHVWCFWTEKAALSGVNHCPSQTYHLSFVTTNSKTVGVFPYCKFITDCIGL